MSTYTTGEWIWVHYGGKWHQGTVEHVHGNDAYTLKFFNSAGQQRLFVTREPERIRPYRTGLLSAYENQNTGRAA